MSKTSWEWQDPQLRAANKHISKLMKRIAELEAQLAAATERAERAEAERDKFDEWYCLTEQQYDAAVERAEAAEKALIEERIESGRPQPGDLPEGWKCTDRSDYDSSCGTYRIYNDLGDWRKEIWDTESRMMISDGMYDTAKEAIEAAQRSLKELRNDTT